MTSRVRAILAAVTLALAVFVVGGVRDVGAYPVPPASGTLQTHCGTVPSGGTCPITFTVTNPNGTPAGGVLAIISSSCGKVSPTQTTTDSNGVASATFTAPTSGCCGVVTITATSANGASAQTTLPVSCTTASGGSLGLPETAMIANVHLAPLSSSGLSPWALALLAASVASLLGGAAVFALGRRRP